MENDSKSPASLSEDSFDDASSRRTIALDLGESTPASPSALSGAALV